MKYKNLIPGWMIMMIILPSFVHAQSLSAGAFFKTDSITPLYLGMDFTQARLINDEASNATVIQSQQFNGINDLIVKENKKYDLQEAYQRTNWKVDTKETEARNQKADPTLLKSSNDADLNRLNAGDIDKLVENFNFGPNRGYGILLVVAGMDKTKKLATIWFTLVDMDGKKVLFTDMVEGKLGNGFGFRNYWATAIKSAIGTVKSKKYDQWKSTVGNK
jgi:hypothetical protein